MQRWHGWDRAAIGCGRHYSRKENELTQDELKLAAEYHRGFEDGRAARSANLMALDLQRTKAINRLNNLDFPNGKDSHENLSAIASCLLAPTFGWTAGACGALRDELVRLLGGQQ